MATMNICAQLGGNIGETPCAVKMGRPLYMIFTQGKTFAAGELASSDSLKAALKTAMQLERGSANKCYAFPIIREVDDSTEDPELGTLTDGYVEILNEKVPTYALRSTPSFCQAQAMAGFNGWEDKVYIVDDKRLFWYVETDSDGAQGWSVGSLYTPPPRFGGGSAVRTVSTRLSFGTIEEFKGNVGALKIDFDPTKLANTNDVKLKEVDAAAGYTFTIGGEIKCAKTNIYTSYKTLLAVAGAWTAKLKATGASISIDTVTSDDANQGWDITLNDSPTITTGAKIIINLASPTVLAGLSAPVLGIEGIEIEVSKAA